MTHRLHGEASAHTRTPEYLAWAGMIQRCENQKSKHFKDYGGRGIQVCMRWRGSYAAFLADMSRRPSPQHSLDRIDNDRRPGYEPGNVRWATRSEQAINQRNRPRLEHDGLKLTPTEWAQRLGLPTTKIYKRLARGWSVPAALGFESPPPWARTHLEYDGIRLTPAEWGRRLHLSAAAIRQRLVRGWSMAESLGFAPPPKRTGRKR